MRLPTIVVKHAAFSINIVGMLSADCWVKSRLTLHAMTGLVPSWQALRFNAVPMLLQNVKCIPASDVAASEAAFQGVTVSSLAEHPAVHTSSLCVAKCHSSSKVP